MVAEETDGLNPDIDWTLELMFKLSTQLYFKKNSQAFDKSWHSFKDCFSLVLSGSGNLTKESSILDVGR